MRRILGREERDLIVQNYTVQGRIMMFRPYSMLLAVALFLIAGAGGSAVAQTPEELLAVEAAVHEAINAQDVDRTVSYFTDDAVLDYVVAGATPYNGKEEVAAFFSAVFQAWPDYHAAQRLRLASGNIVVTECVATGTHQGEWVGVPATGVSVATQHLDVWEFEGDKVKRLTVYDDTVTLLTQLGAMPASEPPSLEPTFELPAPEPTGLPPMEAVEELTARWNRHDVIGYMKMVALEVEVLIMPLGVPIGRDLYTGVTELYFRGFSDIAVDVARSRNVDMGDGWVMSEQLFTSTHDGEFLGIPATGNYNELRALSLYQIDADGTIVNHRMCWDQLTTLIQVGAVPAPAPSAVTPSTWGEIKSSLR